MFASLVNKQSPIQLIQHVNTFPHHTTKISDESESESEPETDTEEGARADAPPSGHSEHCASSRPMKGNKPKRFADKDYSKKPRKHVAKFANTIDLDDEMEPQSYEEAVNHPMRGKQWEWAIQDEYDSIMKNKTWNL